MCVRVPTSADLSLILAGVACSKVWTEAWWWFARAQCTGIVRIYFYIGRCSFDPGMVVVRVPGKETVQCYCLYGVHFYIWRCSFNKGKPVISKMDKFSENFQRGGGVHFRSKKFHCKFFCFRNGNFGHEFLENKKLRKGGRSFPIWKISLQI